MGMGSDLRYILDYHQGRIELGTSWGAPSLDKHWVFKRNFTVVLGIAGAGKTSLIVYLNLVMAIIKNKKCLIWSSENSSAGLRIQMLNALCGRDIKSVKQEAIEPIYNMLGQYIDLADTTKVTDHYKLMSAIKGRASKSDYLSCIIDPFNSLLTSDDNGKFKSEWKYTLEAITHLRSMQKELDIALYLCVHPATGSTRTKHPDGHEFEGMPKPLTSADAEMGNLFDNRADDYIIMHRYKYHPIDRAYTRIFVAKIKERLTGGMETDRDEPIMAQFNSITQRWYFDGVDILQRAIDVATNEKR